MSDLVLLLLLDRSGSFLGGLDRSKDGWVIAHILQHGSKCGVTEEFLGKLNKLSVLVVELTVECLELVAFGDLSSNFPFKLGDVLCEVLAVV